MTQRAEELKRNIEKLGGKEIIKYLGGMSRETIRKLEDEQIEEYKKRIEKNKERIMKKYQEQ